MREYFYQSKSLIQDVDSLIQPYGKYLFKTDYKNAVFIDIAEEDLKKKRSITSEIRAFVKNNSRKYLSSPGKMSRPEKDEIYCFFLDGENSPVKRGLWLFTSGENTSESLFRLVTEVRKQFQHRTT